MNRSENSECSCSSRIMSSFGTRSDRGRHDGDGGAHAERLTREAPFAEEITRAEHGDDGFLARR